MNRAFHLKTAVVFLLPLNLCFVQVVSHFSFFFFSFQFKWMRLSIRRWCIWSWYKNKSTGYAFLLVHDNINKQATGYIWTTNRGWDDVVWCARILYVLRDDTLYLLLLYFLSYSLVLLSTPYLSFLCFVFDWMISSKYTGLHTHYLT